MSRLSVIIPMYNVEPYVERCLRSLQEQELPQKDYEIICINDGSPDKSGEIVKQLQKEYNNITLINQENKGVSGARNKGIDIAQGKYIMFIDPDDYIKSDTLHEALKTAEKYEAEVSILGYTFLNLDGSVKFETLNLHNNRVYNGIEAYYLARGNGEEDPDRMVAILFKRDLFSQNNLRFLPNVPYLEDGELLARILCLSNRCIFDSTSFYQRTTRPGSATNSKLFYTEKAAKGFLAAALNLKKFQQKANLNKQQKKFLNQPIVKFVILSVSSTNKLPRFRLFLEVITELKNNNFGKLDLVGCNSRYRKLGKLYNSSVFLLYSYLFLNSMKIYIRNFPHRIKKKYNTGVKSS